ncbi:MAG: plasmid pRiA4b ORF-3 family protein [Oscillospiraceae bacterium]|nr:plasmid pRiA4b ORF-3 family protein [Oscillospiraceae bacterium]
MKAIIEKKNISYVISASLGTGCYRHIQISGRKTLDFFAGCILDAFHFDFDHLYSFFMDNKWWSRSDAYHSPYSEKPPYADQIKLSQLGLSKGQGFKFLFDYGDEWRFQCKVLRVLDEDTPEALIIRTVGEAPEQYPCYDEDDFYDDDNSALDENYDFENEEYDNIALPKIVFSNKPDDPVFEPKTCKIPDELLEASFQYKSDKLWKKLNDSDIFAVKLTDGQTGYCNVMGKLGECIALALYIGDEGFRSLKTVMNANYNADPFAVLISQNCLQLELTNKCDIPDDIAESVQKYAKEHNINLRGKNTYPNFPKFESYYTPWVITEQKDFQYLLEAVRAAHEVSDKLNNNRKISLGFDLGDSRIPLLTPADNGYKWTIITLPEVQPESFPAPEMRNDVLVGRINKLKKHGTWEYRHFITSQPAPDEKRNLLIYPSLVITAVPETSKSWIIENSGFFPDEAENIVSAFAEKLLEYGLCPETILTHGERSIALLNDFCKKCGIKLMETDSFEMIDDILDGILHSSSNPFIESQIFEMLSILEQMSENELRSMPPQLHGILSEMIGKGIFSSSLEKKLIKAFEL